MYASVQGRVNIIEVLLAHGALMNLGDRVGSSYTHYLLSAHFNFHHFLC